MEECPTEVIYLFTYIYFFLEYNCLTMLFFLLSSEVNQLCVYTYPLPLGALSHTHPSHPSMLIFCLVDLSIEHQVELPVLYKED